MLTNLNRSYKFRIYLLIVYLVPGLVLLWFVSAFSVNVPYWDEWGLVNIFEKVATSDASFNDFFIQANEHRLFFPKIIFIFLAFISKWNIKYELFCSIFLSTITFFMIIKISFNQVKARNNILLHSANIITCVLIFSLVQYENWLWGYQLAWFLTNACVILAIFVLALSNTWSTNLKLFLAAICCFIASFSLAQGLLSWLALMPSVVLLGNNFIQKIRSILLWSLFLVLTCALYFVNYQKQPSSNFIFLFLKEPLVVGKYFLTILGSPLVNSSIDSPIIGLITISNFLFFSLYALKNLKLIFTYYVAPWLSLGLFAVLFAIVTTLGRASLGIEQAMDSRYTTVTGLLIISLVQMWRLFISCNRKKEKVFNFSIIYSFFICILIYLVLVKSIYTIPKAQELLLQRQSSEACLELIHFIDESPDSCLQKLYPSTIALREFAETISKIGFRNFPKNVAFITQPSKVHGYIDFPPTETTPFTISKSGSMIASGWAILPDSRQLPKIVFFSYGTHRVFFANAVVNLDSPDVAKAFNSSRYTKVRWAANISPKSLPLGETVIKAWVYNPSNNQFINLSSEAKLKVVE